MFKVILFICAATLDHAACDETTALDMVTGPTVSSALQCMSQGQTALAPTAVAPGPGEYLKVVCRRQVFTMASLGG